MLDDELVELAHPLSATSRSDPDDVLAAKRALHRLGYYTTPRYGLTPYPDESLFDSIRTFQRDNGTAAARHR